MPDESQKLRLDEDVAVHIFSVSAAMVGVCLTVIGLFRITNKLQNLGSIGDELLSLDAAVFLFSCITAYLALRSRRANRRTTLERIADVAFLAALSLMAVVCSLIAYELI